MELATRSHLVFDLPLALLLVILGTLSIPSMADQVLYPANSLFTGQSLNQGNYALTMQTDCNLVLYDGGRAVWASGTNGRGSSCRVTMQRDGNLVVYNGNGAAVWSSGTARGTGNYALVLQRDRNLVIYGPAIWATGTNAAGVAAVGPSVPKYAVLTSHGRATPAATSGGVGGRKATPGGVAGEGSNN
ncbi:hypothetical protein Taro_006643 [Colocasia esculenta]|uniref:Bulb-type lectin domain-containing protein n=1 Tax=Colocasia esculenta TaxID=4460 RepID=A0A843TXJ6_COLES|nr:hypothetical protein [Colocasia esculenta]